MFKIDKVVYVWKNGNALLRLTSQHDGNSHTAYALLRSQASSGLSNTLFSQKELTNVKDQLELVKCALTTAFNNRHNLPHKKPTTHTLNVASGDGNTP